jgi:hypothetical protein
MPTDRDVVDVEEVIQQVKQSIVNANLSDESDNDLVVTEVDLKLSVVRKLEAGLDAKWQVPVINKEIGAKASRSWSSTNTVEIVLKPPDIAGTAQSLSAKIDIGQDLANAIVLIRSAVQAGATGQPPFGLNKATVELAFGVSNDGSITLLATGEAEKSTTNTLKLSLGPPTHRTPVNKVASSATDTGR